MHPAAGRATAGGSVSKHYDNTAGSGFQHQIPILLMMESCTRRRQSQKFRRKPAHRQRGDEGPVLQDGLQGGGAVGAAVGGAVRAALQWVALVACAGFQGFRVCTGQGLPQCATTVLSVCGALQHAGCRFQRECRECMLWLALVSSHMRHSRRERSWNEWRARAGKPGCCKLTSRRPTGRRVGLRRLLRRRGARLLPPRLVQLLPRAGGQCRVLQPAGHMGLTTDEAARTQPLRTCVVAQDGGLSDARSLVRLAARLSWKRCMCA
jgi:hypothetical protein